jgi:two-component system, NtrC family, sensor kinase
MSDSTTRRTRFRFRLPRTSLRAALILRVLVPVLLVLGGTVFLEFRTLEAEAEARMQEDVEMIARAIRLPLTHAMEREQEEIISEALRSAFDIRRVYGAYVYGPKGDRLASVGATLPEEPTEEVGVLVSETKRLGEYGSVAGRRVYSYFVPLTDSWGRSLGLLQVTRLRSDIDQYLGRLRLKSGTLLLLSVILVVAFVLLGHRRSVGEPLARLQGGMRDVRAGDRNRRVKVMGPRELAEVAQSFNSMLDALKTAEVEVEERRKAQDRLRKDLAQAEKMAAMGVLSAGVAHELGAPLSVIDGKAKRMLRQPLMPHDQSRSIQEIRGEVRRMESIVRQLLAFGRSGTRASDSVRLDGVTRAAVAALADEARVRNVEVEVSGPIPGPRVVVNQTRLEQAVGNLVRNACHAARSRVGVSWLRSGDKAAVVVEDDGPGVPAGLRTRIFEPFFTTKAPGEGTGLGLSIVHGVAEEHGGRVTVERSELGGARFRLELSAGGQGPADATEGDGVRGFEEGARKRPQFERDGVGEPADEGPGGPQQGPTEPSSGPGARRRADT